MSRTAQHMAAFRALETAKPAPERLFADPYAVRFLTPRERMLLAASRWRAVRRILEAHADRRAPGARVSAVARTRFIDDALKREIAEGARQLVILGAGYDCRALRLSELRGMRAFELDRPAMVTAKDLLLRGTPAPGLRRVPVDFLKDDLGAALASAGYSRDAKTVFLWEGVTNYLDGRSVAAVFDFVAANAPAGSRIIFTYVEEAAIEGRFDAPGLRKLIAELADKGEPWTFGFSPERLPDYLAQRRFELLADLPAADYRRLYWPAMAERGIGYEFYHVAIAELLAHAAH